MINREQARRDEEIVVSRASILPHQEVISWLKTRRENCLRIANFKEGKDRQEWLDDAAFFTVALHLTGATANE